MSEIWQNDIWALSAMLASSETTAQDLLTQYRSRINDLNGAVNAVVYLNPQALDEAKESDLRRAQGRALGPLDGIPMLIKDNLNATGMPTTWGSPLFADYIPESDEIPIERLRQAGVVFMGKTNVPEFTVEGVTENPIFGVTRNPWDTTKIPGGSSGGSVAAVALGLSPCSVGTDGGGSVRRPASYTNLVGMKTSIGRVPRGNGLPQLLLDMETVGPITRSVRDQAMLLDALSGPDRRDHRSMRFGAPSFCATLDEAPKNLRILAVEIIDNAPVDPEITRSFRAMTDTLASLGHDVSFGPLPVDVRPLYERWTTIADIGLALLLQRNPDMAKTASPKYVDWAHKSYHAPHLLEIIEIIDTLRNQAAMAFDSVDIIMTPSSAAMPWSTEMPFPTHINGGPSGPRGSAVFSGWVNAIGHPAISIPGQHGVSGMPIGVQFTSDFGQDAMLLSLAQQIEQSTPWQTNWPSLAHKENLV
ncbi:amidase [Pacificibacter marinus]|uniref:Acylamidase n=1 Tax=Pacificibacter marinus TaxID=658057 RepID=A0A1Y5T6D6_9RHOB|nr:amidase [Pacificibacter marinus]SEL22021.1 aspartyl-tRNA(Asn)/glutamyl-tRNA(Gln) amidotransferase subunit A [Pacificibacter marinus]SLN56574.1 Acylamidase [Pacificibacter marinus]